MSNLVIVSDLELRRLLFGLGLSNGAMYFNDAKYVAPSSEWLLAEFDEWFGSFLETFGLGYSVDKWDCDDFADLYSALARVCHRKTPGALDGHGLPVGIIHFLQPGGAGHAVVVAYTSDKGFIFIDPQVRRNVIILALSSLKSAWLVKI